MVFYNSCEVDHSEASPREHKCRHPEKDVQMYESVFSPSSQRYRPGFQPIPLAPPRFQRYIIHARAPTLGIVYSCKTSPSQPQRRSPGSVHQQANSSQTCFSEQVHKADLGEDCSLLRYWWWGLLRSAWWRRWRSALSKLCCRAAN